MLFSFDFCVMCECIELTPYVLEADSNVNLSILLYLFIVCFWFFLPLYLINPLESRCLLSFKLGELSNLFIDMVQREISCLKLNLTAFASEGTFFFICPTLFICGACYTLSDRILGV